MLNKKLLLIIIFTFFVLTVLTLSGCLEKNNETCSTDSDCYEYEQICLAKLGRVTLTAKSFCNTNHCECKCGIVESDGNFIEKPCP